MKNRKESKSDRENIQHPGDVFNQILDTAIASLRTLPEYYRQTKTKGKDLKQKPGPKPTVVRLKLYLLPDGSELPKLNREDPVIETHQKLGYGYPALCYGEHKSPKFSFSLSLSKEQFKEKIRSLYHILTDKDFSLFTLDSRRQLSPAPFNPLFFKDLRYQGNVIIKIKESSSSIVFE